MNRLQLFLRDSAYSLIILIGKHGWLLIYFFNISELWAKKIRAGQHMLPCKTVLLQGNNSNTLFMETRIAPYQHKKRAVKSSPPCRETIAKERAYSAFSLLHLSQYHIIPRTFPLVVIIFAAIMGLEQHWGTFKFTAAFFVAAFAVLLISAMVRSPPV
jgi:hypothetical protein